MNITRNILRGVSLLGCLLLGALEPANVVPGDAAFGNGLFARIGTVKEDIVVRLEYQKTPLTVCNFVALAEGKMTKATAPAGKPFYDGLTFHRVIADFMIQGGAPRSVGEYPAAL